MQKATVTWNNGRKETMYFRGMIDMIVWYERHHGQFNAFASEEITVQDMRQGKSIIREADEAIGKEDEADENAVDEYGVPRGVSHDDPGDAGAGRGQAAGRAG